MLRTVTEATTEPVTLEEAKAHLRLTHDADDTLVSALISAARETVESHTGWALADAGYLWAPAERLSSRTPLPLWPGTVDAVSYWDGSARTAVAAEDYRLDNARGELSLGSRAEVHVEFTAEALAVIPAALKAAILLIVGELYENAEATSEKSLTANPALNRLLWPYRRNIGV